MKTVLTIAGFDPSSGAGVTADLMVFAANGLFGTACITGLTVQSTLGVRTTHPVEASVIAETLDCLVEDLPPAGIKIGMVCSADNTNIISRYLLKLHEKDDVAGKRRPVVLDPVVRSSSGRALLDAEGIRAMSQQLLPLVGWITPNIAELELLSDVRVNCAEDVPKACRELQRRVSHGGAARLLGVLATGGHLERPDDFLLTPQGEEMWIAGARVETTSTHGTGCALSSAFLSRLVWGDDPQEAARAAKAYVEEALRQAPGIGHGHGPMGHLWPLTRSGSR